MKTTRKYLIQSSFQKALFARIMAKAIDLFLVILMGMIFHPVGLFLGPFYLAFADAFQKGQSFGKKFMGFSVISLKDGSFCSFKQSFIRNLPFFVPWIFSLIPMWGWAFSIFIGIPLVLFELSLLIKLDSGHRLGDVMADTTVIANDPYRSDIKDKAKSGLFDIETLRP